MRGNIGGRVVGVALLVLSVGFNVLQAQKIRSMISPAGRQGALVGVKAPPIAARTVVGNPTRVAFDSGLPTVLYYFSATCGWCERNWTNLEALAAGAQGRYRVVALTSDKGLKAFVEKHDLEVEVMEQVPEETLQAYRFTATPHTVVIDAYGLVTHEWRGAFANGIAEQIEDLFGVMLPGLSNVAAGAQPR